MILYDVSCDICSEARVFSLKTKIRELHKTFYFIHGKDICSGCVTTALLGNSYPAPKTIERELTNRILSQAERVIFFSKK